MTEPVYVDIYQKGAVVKMYFSAVVDAEPASWAPSAARRFCR